MKALIIGCGYVGLALGTELSRGGHSVWGVRRTNAARTDLDNAGIHPLIADITDPASLGGLPADCDWVINCAAPGRGGAQEYRSLYLEGNKNLLARFSPARLAKFVYTSSTGVYCQNDGSLVDETSPVLPATRTTEILAETEQLLLDAADKAGFPAVILRVAGIYGPQRGYWLKQFLAGTAVMEGDGSRRLNMIHRDDVVGAIVAALERGKPGEIYNAADDDPPTQRELFAWLSRRLATPLPPAQVGGDSPTRRAVTNKIVSNRKLRTELGWQLRYPTFREGYEAELKRPARG